MLKVKNGEAVYERDGFIFDKIQYSWHLLSTLYRVALENGNKLSTLDFGGSLGSSYFQNRKELDCVGNVEWSVVEQSNFVEVGKMDIEDKVLRFYYTVDECLKKRKPNLLLLSSVLQYIEKPYCIIEELLKYNFQYIFVDRTSFTDEDDFVTVQKVPPEIYDASYPCWFLNIEKFISVISSKYYLLYYFKNDENANIMNTFFQGMLFKLK